MKIDKFDKQTCRFLNDKVLQALQEVCKALNVSIKSKGGTYQENYYKLRLEFSVIGASGVVQTPERDDFIRYAGLFHLEPTDLDKTILLQGNGTYVISGLKMKSVKYPVLAVNQKTGKTYKLSSQAVERALGRKPHFQFNERELL